MTTLTYIYLLASLIFECFGDIFIKLKYPILCAISYNIMLLFWFKVVESSKQLITIPGLVWLIGG